MISEWELWACAATILRQHEQNAPAHIAEQIERLALRGDVKGVAVWKAIACRLDQLADSGENATRQ